MSGGDFFGDLRDLYQEVILDHGRKPRKFPCAVTAWSFS
jgi:hypothetical protein